MTQQTLDIVNILGELDADDNEGLAVLVRNSPLPITEVVDENGNLLAQNGNSYQLINYMLIYTG